MDPTSEELKANQAGTQTGTETPAASNQTQTAAAPQENRGFFGGLGLGGLLNLGRGSQPQQEAPAPPVVQTAPTAEVLEPPPPAASPMSAETFSPPDVMAGEPKIDNPSMSGQGPGGPTMDAPVEGGVDLNAPYPKVTPPPVETQAPPESPPIAEPGGMMPNTTGEAAVGGGFGSVGTTEGLESKLTQEESMLPPSPDVFPGPLPAPTRPVSFEPTATVPLGQQPGVPPPAPSESPVSSQAASDPSGGPKPL